MPYCATCDATLADDAGDYIDASIVKSAIRAGLRPPEGKLRRTAVRMLPNESEEAVSEKEATLEQLWVEGFLSSDDSSWLLCGNCKVKAGKYLNVML